MYVITVVVVVVVVVEEKRRKERNRVEWSGDWRGQRDIKRRKRSR